MIRLTIALLAIAATSAAADTLDLYALGMSVHPGHDGEFNAINPGLGIGFTQMPDDASRWQPGFSAAFAVYRDSYRETAVVAGVGPTMHVGCIEASLLVSFLNGSGQRGFTVVPVVGVRMGDWVIEATAAPHGSSPQHPDKPATAMVGLFVKYAISVN